MCVGVWCLDEGQGYIEKGGKEGEKVEVYV